MASTRPPVLRSVSLIHFHRSSGSWLSYCENGMTRSASALPARKITLRCRLLPSGAEDHSKPMKAVNLPGSLYFSAAAVSRAHIDRVRASLPFKGS